MRGGRLTGTGRYTITFKETPPVKGFWSITLYNRQHFFATNALNRFSLGTKSKGLRWSPTALSSSMCRTSRQPTTSYRTGYLLRLTNSRFTFAPIGLSRKLPRDAGLRLRSSPLRHHPVTMT
jgi:hypothetical protein